MDRERLYHLYKDVLCKFGSVPNKEEDYEKLIITLINIYQNKNQNYPKEYF